MEKQYGQIIIYKTPDGNTKLEVKFYEDTVWLSQEQLVELYGSSKSNISEHIKHIFEEVELDENSTVRKFRTVEFSSSSPSSNMCFICSLILDLLDP